MPKKAQKNNTSNHYPILKKKVHKRISFPKRRKENPMVSSKL